MYVSAGLIRRGAQGKSWLGRYQRFLHFQEARNQEHLCTLEIPFHIDFKKDLFLIICNKRCFIISKAVSKCSCNSKFQTALSFISLSFPLFNIFVPTPLTSLKSMRHYFHIGHLLILSASLLPCLIRLKPKQAEPVRA